MYEADGGIVVGIGHQPVERIVPFIEELEVTFPILLQEDSKLRFADPGPGNWALDVVLDQEGTIVHSCHGDNIDNFVSLFESLLP